MSLFIKLFEMFAGEKLDSHECGLKGSMIAGRIL